MDERRRGGDYEILDRLSVVEKRQAERWATTREILDRISVIETRQVERWDMAQREFARLDQRCSGMEVLLRGFNRNGTTAGLTLMVQDPKILLAIAALIGVLLGNAGFSLKDLLG